MSLTFDANVLVYASNVAAREFEAAQRALRDIRASEDNVYAFWPVLLAYVRVVTRPGLLLQPLGLEQAIDNVESLLRLPNVRTGSEPPGFGRTFREVAVGAGI